MKYTYSYKVGEINETERKWFDKNNGGFVTTGETLHEAWEEENGVEMGSTTYVVMKATKRNFTPYGMCRDCGDHYIIAKWDRYDRINKETLERIVDVEDR